MIVTLESNISVEINTDISSLKYLYTNSNKNYPPVPQCQIFFFGSTCERNGSIFHINKGEKKIYSSENENYFRFSCTGPIKKFDPITFKFERKRKSISSKIESIKDSETNSVIPIMHRLEYCSVDGLTVNTYVPISLDLMNRVLVKQLLDSSGNFGREYCKEKQTYAGIQVYVYQEGRYNIYQGYIIKALSGKWDYLQWGVNGRGINDYKLRGHTN